MGEALGTVVQPMELSAKEQSCIFESHIADTTLARGDGMCCYHVFSKIADCIVRNCNDSIVDDIIKLLAWGLTVTGINYYLNNRDVGLLAI